MELTVHTSCYCVLDLLCVTRNFYFSADYRFTLYGDVPEFSMYKFPSRASTYKVISGGWALYSEPDFQGKIMYHFGSKILSWTRDLVRRGYLWVTSQINLKLTPSPPFSCPSSLHWSFWCNICSFLHTEAYSEYTSSFNIRHK